jgi:hypothetical protein
VQCNTMKKYPGNTELAFYDVGEVDTTFNMIDTKGVILIGTRAITKDILFSNGLFQNVLNFYDMFESMGYKCYCLVNEKVGGEALGDVLKKYRWIEPEDIVQKPFPIKVYIEIGMSIDTIFRDFLRRGGTKIVKLYLGNILNIDGEMSLKHKDVLFAHHVPGYIDEVWTSPHYGQNIDFMASVNRFSVETGKAKAVPYVWSDKFLDKSVAWSSDGPRDIVICEPNISFQKMFLMPLLLVNEYAILHPEWKGKIHLMNMDKVKYNSHVMNHVMPSLWLWKQGRISLEGRKSICQMMKDYSGSVFVCHQLANDFNYMTFELMTCGFPVLHNSVGWANYGYAWNEGSWDESIGVLHQALESHEQNINVYKGHASMLSWKHSIYNPDAREQWNDLLAN